MHGGGLWKINMQLSGPFNRQNHSKWPDFGHVRANKATKTSPKRGFEPCPNSCVGWRFFVPRTTAKIPGLVPQELRAMLKVQISAFPVSNPPPSHQHNHGARSDSFSCHEFPLGANEDRKTQKVRFGGTHECHSGQDLLFFSHFCPWLPQNGTFLDPPLVISGSSGHEKLHLKPVCGELCVLSCFQVGGIVAILCFRLKLHQKCQICILGVKPSSKLSAQPPGRI